MKRDNLSHENINFINSNNKKLHLSSEFETQEARKIPNNLIHIEKKPTSMMLNDGNASTATAQNSNGNAAALHLLASGPLFGNLGSSTAVSNGNAGMPVQPLHFSNISTTDAGANPIMLNGQHQLNQHQQATTHPMFAALAATVAAANRNTNVPPQPHHPQAEAIQALFAHAASNGMPPFNVYPPAGMRPIPQNFLFDHSNVGYHPYSMEAGRRKNATREVTQPLKVWLEQHHKNPYPTKAEKTVLAIITKMNLTQVSTWFANARRRLKKDNKMTWSPRNSRNADDEDEDGSERPSSALSVLSDEANRKDTLESSSEGNLNCRINAGCSDSFIFNGNKQQLDNNTQKKIWSIADTINLQRQQQHTPNKTSSNCSSSDELKIEHKTADLSSSSDSSTSVLANPSKAMAAMAALMAGGYGNADYSALASTFNIADAQAPSASSNQTSPPNLSTANETQQNYKNPIAAFPFPIPVNAATFTVLNNLAQQQQQNYQQQQNLQQQQTVQQQMMVNPLLAFLSHQNQKQVQNQHQQQLLLWMAAAAAAMKNPQIPANNGIHQNASKTSASDSCNGNNSPNCNGNSSPNCNDNNHVEDSSKCKIKETTTTSSTTPLFGTTTDTQLLQLQSEKDEPCAASGTCSSEPRSPADTATVLAKEGTLYGAQTRCCEQTRASEASKFEDALDSIRHEDHVL